MKLVLGILALLVFLALLPYPHFDPSTASWYLGHSISQRLLGNKDRGIPLESVFEKVTKTTITSPYELSCLTNADCRSYSVANQCKVYCGNTNPSNIHSQAALAKNRVCDPATWEEPVTECACVHGTCINVN